MNEESPLISEKTAWYDKKNVTFSDLLKTVRTVLWTDNIFFRKEFLDTSVKIQLQDEELRNFLGNLLAKMMAQAA
jgi:hypothetical protein